MTETLMKWVLRLRALIYIVLLLTVVGIEINHYVHADEPPIESPQTFWPPDMVPHPMPPEPEPNDDNMAHRFINEESITIFSDFKQLDNWVC